MSNMLKNMDCIYYVPVVQYYIKFKIRYNKQFVNVIAHAVVVCDCKAIDLKNI